MARKKKGGASREPDNAPMGERELVVILERGSGLRAVKDELMAPSGARVDSLSELIAKADAHIEPLFGLNEDRMQARVADIPNFTGEALPDFTTFYKVEAEDDALDELAEKLAEDDLVHAAYVKPAAEPAVEAATLNDMVPADEEPPSNTPNFTSRQVYLEASPEGIDAFFAHGRPGGKGQNVRIIDVEGAWRFTHEDLLQNQGGVIGTQSTNIVWRNHGTAVVGEYGGDENAFGVTGICPRAHSRGISIFGGLGSANAIRQAADLLQAGDILLIELHRPGPRHNFAQRQDQLGYIAIEWWEDDFAALRYATLKGVIVVEAAGNGAENLDDPIYSVRPNHFPQNWTNPFNRANRDSRCIIVGAGAPPPGTHGRNHGPDRSRLGFSNWGNCVDAQGHGREVTTTGYGDLQGGSNEDLWYTDTFSGTSSASPIVVGALGCIQGMLRHANKTLLTPLSARELLRTTGSPQQDAPNRPATQRIGNRPNLKQMTHKFFPVIKTKDLKDNIKENAKEFEKLQKENLKDRIKDQVKENVKEVRDKIKDQKEKDIRENLQDVIQGKIRPTEELQADYQKVRDAGKLLENFPFKNVKDLKDRKELKEKDSKEFKEKDSKELKEKDSKEKELKEFKEKEFKEFKEKDKDIKEVREGFDHFQHGHMQVGAESGDLQQRLAELEAAVVELTHFISPELRPDLSGSPYSADDDNLSQDLEQAAEQAKSAKDNKDLEKPREG